ncbi:MAG: hypothetical protein LVQ96_03780 [Thermoplasmatales archaeon]|nr:hypothetical protein [Thermoplasmatales archaeon]MCW6170272.1 hypothetical protein [Thermoplasmatales archaeon]
MKKVILALIVVMILLGSSLLVVSNASGYAPPLASTLTLPSYIGEGQNFTLYVNDTTGFSNYSVTVYIAGQNMTGASPSFSYHNTSKSPNFAINFKAPFYAQTLHMQVFSTGNYNGKTVSSPKYNTSIKVIAPITFVVSVSNPGTGYVKNLTIDFYMDSTQVHSEVISSLGPGSSVNVTYNYTNPAISNGVHTLGVSTSNPLIEINGKTGLVTIKFYYGSPPNYTWIYYVAAVVAVFMALLAYSAGRRNKPKVSKPKWKT